MPVSHNPLSAAEQSEIRACAHALADAARAAILPLFRTNLSSDNKDAGGFDPVTEADRAALLEDMRRAFSAYDDADGCQIPARIHLFSATRPRAALSPLPTASPLP